MMISAVLWDVDDTLFDYSGTDREAALRHLAEAGLLARYPSAEAALDHWRAVMDRHYARFLAAETDFAGHRRDRAREMTGLPLTDAEADAWFDVYRGYVEAAWRLCPDALPALRALAGSHRHAVLSNSLAAYQDRKLRTLGIRDHFEAVLCSAELGHAKPDPAAFHAGCRALGLPAEAVAYVGDRRDIDAEAASAAGLYGIWLDRTGEGRDQADLSGAGGGVARISSLAELPALLRSAGPAGPDGPCGPGGAVP